MNTRTPDVGAGHSGTVRQRIHAVLLDGPVTARDVSQRVGIPEHDVAAHLAHVARSLKRKGKALIIESSTCLDCGFNFPRRHRYTRPGHCPQCRGLRVSLPRFRIK